MTSRQLLEEIKAERKILTDKLNCIYQEVSELDKNLNRLKLEVVLEEGLLKESKWILVKNSGNSVYLNGRTTKEFKKLSEMMETDYHCHPEIEPGVHLNFNDGEVTLDFRDMALAINFINRMDLKIDTSSLEKERDRHNYSYTELSNLLENFKKHK